MPNLPGRAYRSAPQRSAAQQIRTTPSPSSTLSATHADTHSPSRLFAALSRRKRRGTKGQRISAASMATPHFLARASVRGSNMPCRLALDGPAWPARDSFGCSPSDAPQPPPPWPAPPSPSLTRPPARQAVPLPGFTLRIRTVATLAPRPSSCNCAQNARTYCGQNDSWLSALPPRRCSTHLVAVPAQWDNRAASSGWLHLRLRLRLRLTVPDTIVTANGKADHAPRASGPICLPCAALVCLFACRCVPPCCALCLHHRTAPRPPQPNLNGPSPA
ncbi:uncharacterized protein PSFLO_01654 [Pseudozyma flocculosa]|uniref:Uncharacterized protein n=1 Tax=Pseudozyma flocculosa TaxID=84751 RepID=A0A5C3EV87_9BASI|nr:uncharacterized protein PSFLO_01654 [Pseudozyma flocculosa]